MKFPTKLTELDIIALLDEYHSELRKLKQKMVFVKSKIADLEVQLEGIKAKSKRAKIDETEEEVLAESDTIVEIAEAPKVKGKPGRKPKAEKETSTPEEKPANKLRRQRSLSEWDNMVLESLREKGKALASNDLYTLLETKVREAGLFETEEKLRFKLNQILVKLSNKRGELAKVAYPGRGFAYALPEWMSEKGKLLKEFMFEKEKKAKKPGRKKKAAEKKAESAPVSGKRRGRRPKSASLAPAVTETPEATEQNA